MRIAIADDEPLIRQYYAEMLAELGHEVVVAAANGRELVEGCRQAQPDLVISDIRMPELDGIAAVSQIAAERPVATILVSAYHDPELLETAGAAPVLGYLVKPIERADLETSIAVARGRFAQLQSLADQADRLQQALADRKLIEKAKGLLMQQTGLGEAEAHRRLQKVAADRNLKLAQVAQMIITAAEASSPGGPAPGRGARS